MRTTYNASKKRIHEAAEKGQLLTSKWAHFNSMSFLDKLSDVVPEIIEPDDSGSYSQSESESQSQS